MPYYMQEELRVLFSGMSIVRCETCNRSNLQFSVRFVPDIVGSIVACVECLYSMGYLDCICTIHITDSRNCRLPQKKYPSIDAAIYYSSLENEQKKVNHELFFNKANLVMICTTAFGTGIGEADVRYVIHCRSCNASLDYIQMAGRVGRDSMVSECITFTNDHDMQNMLNMPHGEEDPHKAKIAKEQLLKYQQILISVHFVDFSGFAPRFLFARRMCLFGCGEIVVPRIGQ